MGVADDTEVVMRVVEDDSGSMLSLAVVNLHQATVVPYQITRLGQPTPKAKCYHPFGGHVERASGG